MTQCCDGGTFCQTFALFANSEWIYSCLLRPHTDFSYANWALPHFKTDLGELLHSLKHYLADFRAIRGLFLLKTTPQDCFDTRYVAFANFVDIRSFIRSGLQKHAPNLCHSDSYGHRCSQASKNWRHCELSQLIFSGSLQAGLSFGLWRQTLAQRAYFVKLLSCVRMNCFQHHLHPFDGDLNWDAISLFRPFLRPMQKHKEIV